MQKKKLNKLIAIVGSIAIVIGIIAGVLLATQKPDDIGESTDSFDLTKKFENIRVSGDVENIVDVDIKVITKEDRQYNSYSFAIDEMDKLLDTTINEAIFFEVSFLDANGKEIDPEGIVTVYVDNVYIDIYDGYYDYGIINGKCVEEYTVNIHSVPTGDDTEITKIFFDLDKSATVMIVNSVDADYEDDGKDNIQIKEIKEDEETVDEDSILEFVNDNYKVKEFTMQEIKDKYNISNNVLVKGINYIRNLDAMVLSCYETEQSMNQDENDFKILSSNSAIIYLYSGFDETIDYVKEESMDFKDAFGFDYKTCEGTFDVLYKALTNRGISIDFEDATLNKTDFAIVNESTYNINNAEEIVKTIFTDLEYDEIMQAVVNYDLGNYTDPSTNEEISTIDQVTLVVFYKKDNIEKMRSLVYSVSYTTEEILDKNANGGETGLW